MEQHPVPQNVTTFQFRLVGDMTIKQFGYLAGGLIGGYICYKLPLPFFFTWPLAIASGLLGFGLAFVPVEERPMDVWIASFFKNVYSPTQWVWQKEKRAHEAAAAPTRVASPVAPTPTHAAPRAHKRPSVWARLLAFILPQKPAGTMPPAPPRATAPQQPKPGARTTVEPSVFLALRPATSPLLWLRSLFQVKAEPASPPTGFSVTNALTGEQQKPASPPPPPQAPPKAPLTPPAYTPSPREEKREEDVTHRVVDLQTQLSDALRERERLEQELIALRKLLAKKEPVTAQPLRQAGLTPPPAATRSASIRVIAPEAATEVGLPRLTTFPNVVTGIVKDSWGNLLAGMLVTVRDKDDVPVRALKTNKLGQFAASTPLPNGTYVIEIEDPKESFVFDKAQISLTGAVAPAIEVIAKSQKQVERDKLAREIFGAAQSG